MLVTKPTLSNAIEHATRIAAEEVEAQGRSTTNRVPYSEKTLAAAVALPEAHGEWLAWLTFYVNYNLWYAQAFQ